MSFRNPDEVLNAVFFLCSHYSLFVHKFCKHDCFSRNQRLSRCCFLSGLFDWNWFENFEFGLLINNKINFCWTCVNTLRWVFLFKQLDRRLPKVVTLVFVSRSHRLILNCHNIKVSGLIYLVGNFAERV